MEQIRDNLRDKLITTAICGTEDHAAAISELLGAAGQMLTRVMSPAQAAELITSAALEAAIASTPVAGHA